MKTEIIQNGIRGQAVKIVKLCAQRKTEEALLAVKTYEAMLQQEISNARAAIASVEQSLMKGYQEQKEQQLWNNIVAAENDNTVRESIVEGSSSFAGSETYTNWKRQEAAGILDVSTETLRTWERNGLVRIRRSKNGYRVYSAEDLERLNIIRTLRCANYSLSSILRLLNHMDEQKQSAGERRYQQKTERKIRLPEAAIEAILNTPEDNEDIISVCDQLIISLQNNLNDAGQLSLILKRISHLT